MYETPKRLYELAKRNRFDTRTIRQRQRSALANDVFIPYSLFFQHAVRSASVSGLPTSK